MQTNQVHRHGVVPDKLLEKTADYFINKKGHEHIGHKINEQRELHKQLMSQALHPHNTPSKAYLFAGAQTIKIYTMKNQTNFSYAELKKDSSRSAFDKDVNEAYRGVEATYDFFNKNFGVKAITQSPDIKGYVHYDEGHNNASWDGKKIVWGDGDGKVFNSFARFIDISAHELSHALTENIAGTEVNNGIATGLTYSGESGSLNEAYSDIFGFSVDKELKGEDPQKSDWYLAKGLLIDKKGRTYALRNLLRPGCGYINHPVLGTDSQLDHLAKYNAIVDHGQQVDPHDGSGIGNKAFATAVMNYHGNTVHAIVKVFFKALPKLTPDETFKGLAEKTLAVARSSEFSGDTAIYNSLMNGWRVTGVLS